MICPRCGERNDAPQVDPVGPVVVCGVCCHREPFRRLPLFVLTGASGTGKSTVGRLLLDRLAGQVVVLEQDLLWIGGRWDPGGDFAEFRQAWLRLAAAIHQHGRPVLLCGTVLPDQFERRPERALFAEVRYLALVGPSDQLSMRLHRRPTWRQWSPPRIMEMIEFNDWIRRNAPHTEPPMELLETASRCAAQTADDVAAWVSRGLVACAP